VPTPITDPGFLLKVATPTFVMTPGVYTYTFNATVNVLTVGATIHYTQNGADPTETDPVVASGSSVPVAFSQALKARA
jgi:hypothetical protein